MINDFQYKITTDDIIGIDLTPRVAWLQHGMTNTLKTFLKYLPKKTNYSICLFLHEESKYLYEEFTSEQFIKIICEKPETTKLRGRLRVLYSPFNNCFNKIDGAISLLTKHDLIPAHFESEYGLESSKMTIEQCYSADYIHTISDYVKDDLISRTAVPAEIIEVIKNPAPDQILTGGDISKIFPQLKNPYLIYPATYRPHKNHKRLLDAMLLCDSSINLVLTTGETHASDRQKSLELEIKKRKLESRVFLLGCVSRLELSLLYRNAHALVFPSLAEGFGLPLLEAMQFSLKILASNSSCIPEITEKKAIYFNPYYIQSIAKAIDGACEKEKTQLNWQDTLSKYNPRVFGLKMDSLFTKLIFKSKRKELISMRDIKIKKGISFINIEKENISLLEKGKLVVALDCSRLFDGNRFSGISKYVESLLLGLKKDKDIDLIPFYNKEVRGFKIKQPKEIESLKLKNTNMNIYSISMAKQLIGNRYAVYHSPYHPLPKIRERNISYCLTVHDIFHLTHEGFYNNPGKYITKSIVDSIRKSDEIICVSEYTAKELKQYNKDSIDGLSVIHLHSFLEKEPIVSDNKLTKKKKVLLIPFQNDPRKNFGKMLRISEKFLKLNNEAILCIYGKIENMPTSDKDRIKEFLSVGRIELVNSPSDIQLSRLYSDSFAFLYLSLAEGFGLPPLEAIEHQCVPLVLKNTSLAEVYGDWEYCLDPDSTDDYVVEKINYIFCNQKVYDFKFSEFSKKYTQDLMISKNKSIYLNALRKKFLGLL